MTRMGSYQYTDLLLTSREGSCQKNVRSVSYIKFPQTQYQSKDECSV